MDFVKTFFSCGGLKTGIWACHVRAHLLDYYAMWNVVEDDKGRIEEEYPEKGAVYHDVGSAHKYFETFQAFLGN